MEQREQSDASISYAESRQKSTKSIDGLGWMSLLPLLHKELSLDIQTESKLSFVCSRLLVLFSAPIITAAANFQFSTFGAARAIVLLRTLPFLIKSSGEQARRSRLAES
jgi:hypothetical protein